jgi:hypothetical protein
LTATMRWVSAILYLASASWAEAQKPAGAAPPLRGLVRSVGGLPLADAEVTVDGIRASVRSDARGGFSVPNVSKGIHSIGVRRIGYLPSVTAVEVPAANALTLVLVPSRPELDTITVTAQVNVLAGVVVDEHNRPISGASVDLIGTRRGTVTTGDDGWFTFTAVRSGPSILHVLRPGFAGATQSVRLDDWRGVVVHMTAIDTTLSKSRQAVLSGLGSNARHVWLETQMRLDRRNVGTVVVTSEELAPLSDLTLGDAITKTPSAVNLLSDLHANHNSACVLLDGSRMVGPVSLDTYNTDDVEFVELYPPGATPPRSVTAYLNNAGCSARAGAGGSGGTFYAVVWLKN